MISPAGLATFSLRTSGPFKSCWIQSDGLHPSLLTPRPSSFPSCLPPVQGPPGPPKLFAVESGKAGQWPSPWAGPHSPGLLFQINYYADMIYASAGISAAHSQYVTVGAGVVNIVMTGVSVSDREYPFHWGWGGGRCPAGRQGPYRAH